MSGSAVPETDTPPLAVYRLHETNRKPVAPASAASEEHAWNEPLLRQNAIWFCRLRWMVVAVLAAAGIAGCFRFQLAALGLEIPPYWPLGTAALLSGMNVAFGRLVERDGEPGWAISIRLLLWAQIVTDLLVLTLVIHWLGSGLPSVQFMYLFHIILACIVFPPGESFLVAGLAAGFYLLCLFLESAGVLTRRSVMLGVTGPELLRFGREPFLFGVSSMLLIWAVIWYLVSRLAGTLRRRERELALTNLRLKASSEERAKHMLQTTHQLKAPFAAIHAQTQLLLGDYCGALPTAAREVVGKMSARCMALSRQIQEMLQLANLRSQGQTSPPTVNVDLATMLEAALGRIEPAARQRGIQLEKTIQPVKVSGVEDHLTMMFENLIVNAVNYSYDRGMVAVGCRVTDAGQPVVTVRDHGIGIPEDKLPRIFDDYYRTDEAVQHNRTSTGLGLAIVRQAAQEAGLEIEVESAPGWGTCFTINFPGGAADPEAISKS